MEAAKWVICIRGLKWTKRGQEEEEGEGGTRDQERGERARRGSGEEKRRITRDWLCHVKPHPSALSVDDTIVNHRGIDYQS